MRARSKPSPSYLAAQGAQGFPLVIRDCEGVRHGAWPTIARQTQTTTELGAETRIRSTKCVDWSDTPLTRTHTSKQLAVSQSRSLAHAHRRQLTGSSPHHLISPHLISPDRPSQFAERMYRAQIGLDFFATDYDLFVNLPLQPTTAQLLLQQGCNQ